MLFRKKKAEFPQNPEVPQHPVNYPYGLCIKTESGFFLTRSGSRLKIVSERALESWNFLSIIQSSEAAAKNLKVTGRVGFRDGTIINDMGTGKHYLISKNLKRHITSPDVFEKYGLSWGDVLLVSSQETEYHEDGEVLN